jgi:hypothetical protein
LTGQSCGCGGDSGLPLRASQAEPGHVHDITAARVHALPALPPQRWALRQHLTASPRPLTQILRAALVLTQFERKYSR